MIDPNSETNLYNLFHDHIPLPYTYSTPNLYSEMGQHSSTARHGQSVTKNHHYDVPRNSHPVPSSFFLSPIVSNESTFSYDDAIDTRLAGLTKVVSPISQDFPILPKEDEEFSPLLSLPLEILYRIIELVYYDDSTISINSNLESFSKTIPLLSKKIHQLSLCFLYKYTIFNRPHSFDKFLNNLLHNPTIGKYVEYMDFQQFTSIGLGRTGRMNQEIQMVTSTTITTALQLTPNLIEFLASENIQDDMDVNVLDLLFNKLKKVQALDFCGASSDSFVRAFQALDIATDVTKLIKLSFHDCSSLTPDIFIKILPKLVNLRRLDLTHTSVTSNILLTHLPHSIRLTHLSLARCSKLTTKDLINLLTQHPAVCNNSLTWLNLQIDSNVVSPLTDIYLLYTLKHLNAPGLKYLNLSGLPINKKILTVIKNKFLQLESLCLGHGTISLDDLTHYLNENTIIKFLDLTGIKPPLTTWSLTSFLKAAYLTTPSLEVIEYDYKLLYELTANEYIKITPVQQSFSIDFIATPQLPQIWKFYDNEGRRAWIYKIPEADAEYNDILNAHGRLQPQQQSNLVYYDLETGDKIVSKVSKPAFLKYGSRKINCSIGYFNLNNSRANSKGRFNEDVWPVEFSQRGIYNYYSLNIK